GPAAGRDRGPAPAGPARAPGGLQVRLRLLLLRQGPERVRRQPVSVVPRPAPRRSLAQVLVVAAHRPRLRAAVPAAAAAAGHRRRAQPAHLGRPDQAGAGGGRAGRPVGAGAGPAGRPRPGRGPALAAAADRLGPGRAAVDRRLGPRRPAAAAWAGPGPPGPPAGRRTAG